MSISEEELQKWEMKLIRDNPRKLLHLIENSRKLQKNLDSAIAKETKQVMLHAVTQFELQEVRQQLKAMTIDRNLWQDAHNEDCPNIAALEAAERREKVAMRALENIAKRAWSTPDDTVRWYLEQAEKEFSNER